MRFKLKYRILFVYLGIISFLILSFSAYTYTKYKRILYGENVKNYEQAFNQMQENLKYKASIYRNFTDQIARSKLVRELLEMKVPREEFARVRFENIDKLRNMIDVSILNSEAVLDVQIYQDNPMLPTDGYYLFDLDLIREEPYYLDMIEHKKSAGWYQNSRVNGENEILYLVPIVSMKESAYHPIGFVITRFQQSQFEDILNQVQAGSGEVSLCGDGIDLRRMMGSPVRERDNRDTNYRMQIEGTELFLDLYIPYSAINEAVFSINLDIWVIAAIAVFVSGVLIYLSANLLTKRIYRLRRKMELIQDNQTDLLFDIGGNDEISQLDKGLMTMVEQIRNLIQEIYEKEFEKKESELKFLQIQINPHFLYNTLNSVKTCIDLGYERNAAEMVTALADFYRISLNQGQNELTVEQEVLHSKKYVLIEKYRSDYEFEVHYKIEEDAGEIRIIKTVLQPLIENSIRHGFEYKKSGGCILVQIGIEEKKLHIRVQDNGCGVSGQRLAELNEAMDGEDSGRFLGLENTNKRLKYQYGRMGRLYFSNVPEGGFRTDIYLDIKLLNYDGKVSRKFQSKGEAQCIPY